MLVPEQALGGEQRRVLGRFSPFMIRCCQSMFTLTLSSPRSPSLWITYSVIPMFRIMIFIAGSEFLCSSQSGWPCSASFPATAARPSTNQAQLSLYGVWNG